jgi:two-component system, chemotaxis family, response regulator Rcp1
LLFRLFHDAGEGIEAMTIRAEKHRPVEILLVEDNPVDVLVMQKGLKESHFRSNLTTVPDGEEALEFLHRRGNHASAPAPDLIILDLNLPRKSGRDVLAEIKQDPGLLHIPVVVLTSSEAETDITVSYRHHANCFITKPGDLEEFLAVFECIQRFWLTVVRLPGIPQT